MPTLRLRPLRSALVAVAVCLIILFSGGPSLPFGPTSLVELAAAPYESTSTTTLLAVADARLSEAFPRRNYGVDPTLQVAYSSTGFNVSLIRFDVAALPPGLNITSATLRVHAGDKTGELDPVPVSVRRVTSAWDQGTVNWNSRPSIVSSPLVTASTGGHEWVAWDLTTQTRQWYGGHSNFGIQLGGPASSTYALYMSSLEGSAPPELVVVHESGATLTPTPTASPRPTLTATPTPSTTPLGPTPTFTPTPPGVPDLGDAPDSSNSSGVTMNGYPGVQARFPTVFGPGSPPHGPRHRNQPLLFYLGDDISAEGEADSGFDADGVHNISPPAGLADRDGADDGLGLPATFGHCLSIQLPYVVTVLPGAPSSATLNLWLDWNRNGRWGEVLQCAGQDVPEWAVRNEPVNLPGPGTYTFSTPFFLAFNPDPTRDLWLRITIGEKQGSGPDGRGVPAGYDLGETEDYLMPGVPPATATPTGTRSPTPTVIRTPTASPIIITPFPTSTPTSPVIITVMPTPTATVEPVITVMPTPTATPRYHDLVAMDIEVSQGIQNLDNEMPLVRNRRTIVRVYGDRENSWGPATSNVNARLFGTHMGTGLDLPGSPLEANNPITVHGGGSSRRSLAGSWWFYLPLEWRSGTITLRAEINHDDNVAEQDKSDNEISATVTFHAAEIFNAVVVPMHLHPDGDRSEPSDCWWGTESYKSEIYDNMLRLHPIAEYDVWRFTSSTKPDWHWLGDEWDLRETSDKNRMLTKIVSVNNWTSDWANDLHYMGTVDPDIDTGGTGGMARTSSFNCWVMMTQSHGGFPDWVVVGGQTMAHEMGHTEGRLHANCEGTEAQGGAIDPDYPWPFNDCHLAEVDDRGYYGLDVYYSKWGLAEPEVLDNVDDAYPLMGYKWPRWIDPYSYCALLNRYGVSCNLSFSSAPAAASLLLPDLPAADPERVQALRNAAQLLTVIGALNSEENTGKIEEIALQPAEQVFDDNVARAQERLQRLAAGQAGDFSLEIRAGDGALLYTQPILEDQVFDTPERVAGFQELLPWPPQAASVVLTHDGTVLDAHSASAHRPTVTVLFPNGGEQLSPHPTIAWQGGDQDGDDLRYHVLYSSDGGDTWRAIALGAVGSQFHLQSPERLSGSDRGLIRVVASDGFHTGQDDSNGTFTVPGTHPMVSINHPVEGRTYRPGRPLILDGFADDVEDGVLRHGALLWRSNVDGVLGNGEEVYLPPRRLSLGPHRLTLVATDSDALSAQAAVRITIGPLRLYLPMLYR